MTVLWDTVGDLLPAFIEDAAPRPDQDARWLGYDVSERLEGALMAVYEGQVRATDMETAQLQFAVAVVNGLVAMCPPDWDGAGR